VLLIVLHDNQASYTKHMSTPEFDRPPLDFHAHWTRIVVNLRNVGEDLRVDLRAYGFGEMLRELGVLDLPGEGLFHAEGGAFVEFCYRGLVNRSSGCLGGCYFSKF
jgi:hypothetical protein